ncbi:MAG: beta-glycosidase [Ferruginibacter sp.]|nr:beta-glycosidase [Ferruginibacter sp.]
MKQLIALHVLILLVLSLHAQTNIQWVATSPTEQWKIQNIFTTAKVSGLPVVEIEVNKLQQRIEGFGTCFNELGWTSLNLLSARDRESILRELFSPGVGANFTICRMPVGANDFSRNWYSYNETEGDFEMKNFSIANDLETLVPFIKNALKYNSSLRIWASPWSPPSWMKYNHHYAARSALGNSNFQSEEWGMDMRGISNGLTPDKEGKEGTDMFIQKEKYYRAYALYFSKFIEAYRKQKVNIEMVMPQNEFNSAQVFPSCTWTAAGLAKFISYLGPQVQQLGVKVFFGTMERENAKLLDTILTDQESSKYVKGAGFQWAGKGAIAVIHKKYPELTLYQTEQECGNSKNDWKYCVYTWGLMKHYLTNGANVYTYWNTSLKQGGISTWGWKQNSLVSVDTISKTYKYNYEYYLMKHLSHFVKPGAQRVATSGTFNNVLAFINPDKSVVVVVQNESDTDKKLQIKLGKQTLSPLLKANSFNTFLIKQKG